ncbi:MAG: PIN domain-containing protein [Gemmatimonadales bacterium]
MRVAYVDSSVVLAIAFAERGGPTLAKRLKRFPRLCSAPLLEAEVLAALRREEQPLDEGWLDSLTWIHPERPLRQEISRVLKTGYLRGADCWHLATALYVAPNPRDLTFLTLDARQRDHAAALGFAT